MRYTAKWPSVQATVSDQETFPGVKLTIETVISPEEAALLDYDYIGQLRELVDIIVKQFNGLGKALPSASAAPLPSDGRGKASG